jgi:predicted ATPase
MAPRANGITRFGLRNFKAFRYLEDIELKPLTLLVGANSSGKSSIFQSLLLLKQSLLSSGSAPLKFDGEWVRLGGFASVISDFDPSRILEYRLQLRSRGLPSVTTPSGETVLSFESSSTSGSARLKELATRLAGPGFAGFEAMRLDQDTLMIGDRAFGGLELYDVGSGKLFEFDSAVQLVVGAQPDATEALSALLVHRFFLREIGTELSHRLDYLGPVRADPRPFYPVSEEPEVGTRGEGAVPYLLKHKDDVVPFVLASSEKTLRHAPLLRAINEWLAHMRVTPGLAIAPVESIAYTAFVRRWEANSRPVNLAQVGFGVSQLLPVLIQGLRKPADAWILFEQPEIHLHPRLQAELGDFFLACARTGKTLMVETHSDHMVHRIRRRIAEDATGELADMVQILFVHAGTEDNPGSYVEPLRVAPDGSIENWPDDFLQDSADEALAILRARQARNTPSS